MALPRGFSGDGKRVFCIEAIHGQLKRRKPVVCKFRILTAEQRLNLSGPRIRFHGLENTEVRTLSKQDVEGTGDEEDTRDVRLLQTCWESRAIFKEAFPYTLPMASTKHGQSLSWSFTQPSTRT